jgi:hypothetical protein
MAITLLWVCLAAVLSWWAVIAWREQEIRKRIDSKRANGWRETEREFNRLMNR